MNVSPQKPFQIVYSLFQHEYLGFIFESFIIQLDEKGRLTLQHQNISAVNCQDFAAGLDEKDMEMIKLIDSIQQDVVLKKHSVKKVSAQEFFPKVFNKEKGDLLLQEAILKYVEDRKSKILALMPGKQLFEMGNDGEPTWRKIEVMPEKATVLFHFFRNETNTHYYPTIKYKGEKVDFQYKNAIIVCQKPAWLLSESKLYTFEKEVEGSKLKPFLQKKFIEVPKKVEDAYYKKFIAPLIASFDVYAKGFDIISERENAFPYLSFTEMLSVSSPLNLFNDSKNNSVNVEEVEGKIVFDLSFHYGNFIFGAGNSTTTSVKVEKVKDNYTFHKVKRFTDWEKTKQSELINRGLEIKHGKAVMPKYKAFDWINYHAEELEKLGFKIQQHHKDVKRYFLGKSEMTISIQENIDWFDVNAVVRFGSYEIPFRRIRKYIIENKHEIELPNGQIAVIPEEWFTRYSDLFQLSDESQSGEGLTLKKHHVALVEEMDKENLAKVSLNNKLEKLKEFEKIEDFPLPKNFRGSLRSYQKAGYNWMRFLANYGLGGCLADDMGLGKTVQTLVLLQSEKENNVSNPSLLIMPTSLVYNWELEAKKFAPKLKVFNYTGAFRDKNTEHFVNYDLILTTYGTIRNDADIMKEFYFNYIILDESQAIKNPSSVIAKEIVKLKSKNKLILTGTPIENSTSDLWSQMNFVNPGLLGNLSFFKREFLVPIEKKNDQTKSQRLHNLIKPFVLRRNKSQVEKELPEKTEFIQYCLMSEEQQRLYEETKSFIRNQITETIEKKGIGNSQLYILQGLTKLRQLANHPAMAVEDYAGDSGKMEEVLSMLQNAISENHKILIFSQFVKHLELLRKHLDKENIRYSYLDGSTRDRQKEVEVFQQDNTVKIFLISLKAGGVGLNLTAADYVFILDPWWNPAAEQQAIDRAHRIGQDKKVFIYKFITKDTLEEKIIMLQNSKKKLANEIISTEESFVKSLTQEDILNLFV
jgi:SNF2 family DNA or RNA helicase